MFPVVVHSFRTGDKYFLSLFIHRFIVAIGTRWRKKNKSMCDIHVTSDSVVCVRSVTQAKSRIKE